jgi:hypothetical protein
MLALQPHRAKVLAYSVIAVGSDRRWVHGLWFQPVAINELLKSPGQDILERRMAWQRRLAINYCH